MKTVCRAVAENNRKMVFHVKKTEWGISDFRRLCAGTMNRKGFSR